MLTVVVLLGVGVFVGRLRSVPAEAPRALDAIIINVALPGLILALIPALDLSPATLLPVAVAWGTLAVGAVLVLALGRLFGWSRRTVGTLLLVVPLGNTSFFGIPATEALLSAAHVPYAIVYDQLGSFLALATYGAVIAARYGGGGDRSSILRRVVTFPPFIALVIAFILRAVGMPPLLADVAERLGSTVTPLAMLAVGMRLRVPRTLEHLGGVGLGLAVKMAAMPAIAYLVTTWVDTPRGAAWQTSIFEAAMPPMVSAAVLAGDADLDDRLAATMVGVGVLVALFVLPLWAGLVR